jgi:hypothetical protein
MKPMVVTAQYPRRRQTYSALRYATKKLLFKSSRSHEDNIYINDMLKSTSVVREEYVVYVVIFSYERAMTTEPE